MWIYWYSFPAVRLPLPSIMINCKHATKTLYRLEVPNTNSCSVVVYTNISYVGMIRVTHTDTCMGQKGLEPQKKNMSKMKHDLKLCIYCRGHVSSFNSRT